MMPDMDGLSLVRALRHLDPQLPILGMTGVPQPPVQSPSPIIGIEVEQTWDRDDETTD